MYHHSEGVQFLVRPQGSEKTNGSVSAGTGGAELPQGSRSFQDNRGSASAIIADEERNMTLRLLYSGHSVSCSTIGLCPIVITHIGNLQRSQSLRHHLIMVS